jgi:hypothetical protein
MAPDGRPVHLRRRPVEASPSRVTEAALKHENLRLDLGRRGALPGDPWQRDFRRIDKGVRYTKKNGEFY